MGGTANDITIPVVMIRRADGEGHKATYYQRRGECFSCLTRLLVAKIQFLIAILTLESLHMNTVMEFLTD